MNYICLFLTSFILLGISCKSSSDFVEIAPNSQKEYNQLPPKSYVFNLANKSSNDVEVAVVNRETRDFVSGFGLKGKADVMVGASDELIIKNESDQTAKIKVSFKEKSIAILNDEVRYVDFTLRNSTLKSIPLIIPGVMNPNLSPMSNSGVGLKIGQKIYFKQGLKKYLLLEVDDTIKDGDKLDVAGILKNRKKELGI